MRITREMAEFLTAEVARLDSRAQVFLFGSRVDDSKKGGDIDILILSPDRLSRQQLRQLRLRFQERFGEQRLDFVNYRFDEEHSFKSLILRQANPV